jgi:hypothetical protein
VKYHIDHLCPICNKPRISSLVSHAKCSKILQQQNLAKNAKHKNRTTVAEFTPAVIDFIAKVAV